MSVSDLKIIDFASINTEDEIVLTISDHLEWDEEHLFILQEKINCYLAFIESGEIFNAYPKSKDKQIVIELVTKYEVSVDGAVFINKVTEFLVSIGVKFRYIRHD